MCARASPRERAQGSYDSILDPPPPQNTDKHLRFSRDQFGYFRILLVRLPPPPLHTGFHIRATLAPFLLHVSLHGDFFFQDRRISRCLQGLEILDFRQKLRDTLFLLPKKKSPNSVAQRERRIVKRECRIIFFQRQSSVVSPLANV